MVDWNKRNAQYRLIKSTFLFSHCSCTTVTSVVVLDTSISVLGSQTVMTNMVQIPFPDFSHNDGFGGNILLEEKKPQKVLKNQNWRLR
jgi:hypothetical protein